MLTDAQKQAVRRSWKLVIPIAETAADLFYKRLFELKPEYEKLFSGDMAAQKRKLLAMLAFVVRSLDWTQDQWKDDVAPEHDLLLVVLALGRRHRELYHVPDESYDVVGEALLWTLDYGLGEAFTDEVRDAWATTYQMLSRAMRMGSSPAGQVIPLASQTAAMELGAKQIEEDLGKPAQEDKSGYAATERT